MLLSSLALLLLHPQLDQTITDDGVWCWFADPRAVAAGGAIYAGWTSHVGSIVVGKVAPWGLSPETFTLREELQADDHTNPSLLLLPNNRLMAFYSKHSGPDMFMRETVESVETSIQNWTPERKLNLNPNAEPPHSGYCYPNPVYLAEEQRILMTWRGTEWKPILSWSDNLGRTWTKGKILFAKEGADPDNRPYIKVAADGKSRMHFLATDGHPSSEPTNSVYHFYYEMGAFYRADGTQIATVQTLPVRPENCDLVYDGRVENIRAWIWDVAVSDDGYPVAVYARLPERNHHEYYYARWDGSRWTDRKITDGGGWFPQTTPGTIESEPYYSGGVVLDHSDPRIVVLSKPNGGRFEIQRWVTNDYGDTWSSSTLAVPSGYAAVRPVVARGQSNSASYVLWMDLQRYSHWTNYFGSIKGLWDDRGPLSNQPQPAANRRALSQALNLHP
ncbi:MAG: BNR-4 repeat-containing protein [Armatimonadetes bacterium]|nr:BNR-4 repeat-containing protein [Armatimonadota bacterium]